MATIKILLRKKQNIKGEFPVALRISKNRKSKLIALKMTSKPEDWNEEIGLFKKSYKNYLLKNRILLQLEQKAIKIIDDYRVDNIDFTLDEFEKKFRGKDQNQITVYDYFQSKISLLEKSGKIGAAGPYKSTRNALFKFAKKTIKFRDISPDFLKRFEVHLRAKKNNQDGGIAFIMRELRALFNEAIDNDIVAIDAYPFRKYKISKLKGRKRRIALSIDEMKKFINVDLSDYPTLIKAHKYFIFSYYTRGMNYVDMMNLKWSDIQDGKIYITREKTSGKLVIKILSPVQDILDYFKLEKRDTPYVFPILLTSDMSPKQIFNRKHKTLRSFNEKLNTIATLAKINKKITSYVARHSYATIMKQKGVSVEVISESMGHSSVLVTMAYLKDFENDYLDEANERLLNEPQLSY